MYDRDTPIIADAMRNDLTAFMRGCIFAICSIRQPFPSVPDQLETVWSGDRSPLFGHKLDAHDYVLTHGEALQRSILAAPDNAARLEIICRVPGIGLVKGGFILQLMGYDVACLDSRNVKREGRNPNEFKSRKKLSPRTMAKHIARYLAETEGQARRYWNEWCTQIGDVYHKEPSVISAMHTCIVPDNYVPF